LEAIPDNLIRAFAAITALEGTAVALALAYLVLAIRQNIWCWAAAIASTSLYLFVMYSAGLYMESALQVFYIGIAVYGWREWSRRGADGQTLPIRRWSLQHHLFAMAGIVVLTVGSGGLLDSYTAAALPYVDSFTTWGAILSTWMVARKVLENWLYWFVVDSTSVWLYLQRELYVTACLFLVYLVLIVVGYRVWSRDMQNGQIGEAG